MIDTCAGEFKSFTPYYYSTYESENEADLKQEISKDSVVKKKIVILGGGPNRIGQGIEFDYCCVHASLILREFGYETIIINSNPETVSTDFDISDKLYFEPVTVEDVVSIYEQEKPTGIIVQLGGQTPLNISQEIEERGLKVLGTPVREIFRAEDRNEFQAIIEKLDLRQPPNGIASQEKEIFQITEKIGFPVLLRPSFVLGGRAMQIVFSNEEIQEWLVSVRKLDFGWPILIDKFLDQALEIDVDLVSDGEEVLIAGIMEHIEKAGIHSGDSACILPPNQISSEQIKEIKRISTLLAKELKVKGLMNLQLAIKDQKIYIIEVNPRASRTVPFVSKATGIPWAKIGALLIIGKSLKEVYESRLIQPDFSIENFTRKSIISVKEAVLPFKKFPGCNIALGPEMHSTGEVMGIDSSFGLAFAKAQIGSSQDLLSPKKTIFLSVSEEEKPEILEISRKLNQLKYKIYCTQGTYEFLKERNIRTNLVNKAQEIEPNVLTLILNKEFSIIINIPKGKKSLLDNMSIRRLAVLMDLPLITTIAGARATVEALESLQEKNFLEIKSLQERLET